MRCTKLALLAGATTLFCAMPATAQTDDPILPKADIATYRGADASARGQDARSAVGNFLRARGRTTATIDSLVQTREHQGRNGRVHLEFEQMIDGKRVYGSVVRAAVGAQGDLLTLHERTVPAGKALGRAAIDERSALDVALRTHHSGAALPAVAGREGQLTRFAKTDYFHEAPTVEAVLVGRRSGQLEHGYLVTTWSAEDNMLWETLIDARGKAVSSELRTAQDSYAVFADHPGVSAQTTVAGAGAGNTQSPIGWLGTSTQYGNLISGNNVRAYLDRDNNNGPDAGVGVVSDGNFVTPWSGSDAPTTTANQAVAVQNLFWLNNVIHDELYRHGFTETALNFQEDNFGNGGLGSDSVDAEAQDGGGTNNANFATPSDGSNPRMQMYLWTLTSPNRDGDLDSDIVWHEYGHGLTWRMIGSMSGSISGAIGEGMSDVLSIIMNDNDVVGEYSTNDPVGIRRYAYEGYPLTLGDFSGSSVHSDGEIYAATLWDLRTAYYGAGLTRDDIMGDIVDGMNFTAPGPDYLDMRNGILDAADSTRDCMIWETFAAHGMGENAAMGTSRGFQITVTEDFTVPSTCTGGDGGGGDPGGNYTLSTNAYKVKGRVSVDLTWSGAATDVDIYRDGSFLTTTANDGAYTDSTGQKGGGSFTYKVCDTGTSTCSNDSTASF